MIIEFLFSLSLSMASSIYASLGPTLIRLHRFGITVWRAMGPTAGSNRRSTPLAG